MLLQELKTCKERKPLAHARILERDEGFEVSREEPDRLGTANTSERVVDNSGT